MAVHGCFVVEDSELIKNRSFRSEDNLPNEAIARSIHFSCSLVRTIHILCSSFLSLEVWIIMKLISVLLLVTLNFSLRMIDCKMEDGEADSWTVYKVNFYKFDLPCSLELSVVGFMKSGTFQDDFVCNSSVVVGLTQVWGVFRLTLIYG